ncbi:putative immunoglobulin-blocking virulence protein [Ureaplasma canigenitalium]|uniref:putative immunoglobulin-blocking virulence protein n=1 Tax=Ureaplasma canigenitalium TaxID=42092 RepID=UPI00068DF662|nr:putative immunoglobulin-blocking virulence protein [Ureaplasma canigenitalium]
MKKSKIALISLTSLAAVSAVATGIGLSVYFNNPKNSNKKINSLIYEHNRYPFQDGNRDLDQVIDSSFDNNLKKLDQNDPVAPEVIEPPKLIIPDIIIDIKEEKPKIEEKKEEELPPPPPPEEKKPEPEKPEQPKKQPEPEPLPPPPPPKKEEPKPTPPPPPEKKEELPPPPPPVKPQIQKKEEKKEPPKANPPVAQAPKLQKNKRKIKVGDKYVEINVEEEPVRPRQTFEEDRQKGLQNRNPYISQTVPKIKSFEVTDEFRNANVEFGRKRIQGINNIPQVKWITDGQIPDSELKDFMNQNPDFYKGLFYKYFRLFESPNVVNFLTEEGKKKYPQIKNIQDRDLRYITYLKYLDYTKFTKLSSEAEKELKKGYTLGGEVYIEADGSINSHTFSPPAENNNVIAEYTRNNYKRRVFSYNSPWKRSPSDILNGSYDGWIKDDKTKEYAQKYNFNTTDGIEVSELIRVKPINEPGQINKGLVVKIDASNPAGYKKTLELINQLKNAGEKITSYRIFNIGKNDTNQSFYKIFEALPDELPQLELFFETQNTSYLKAIKNKHIKELSLYTGGNSLLDTWNINPLALKNVEWVNTADYNVSRDYGRDVKVYSRITFNTLSFDDEDYLEGSSNPFELINDGLRLAYWVRNNEGFFQGGFGSGLSPDHDERGNSYPTGLDLGRMTKLKSLRGLRFNDHLKPQNGSRKLILLTLHNDGPVFEISAEELNQAQFKDVMSLDPMVKAKILYSNGSITNTIRVTGGNLNSDGLRNLAVLKELDRDHNLKKLQITDQSIKGLVSSSGFGDIEVVDPSTSDVDYI